MTTQPPPEVVRESVERVLLFVFAGFRRKRRRAFEFYEEGQTRDMIRSILPSTARSVRKEKAFLKRSCRGVRADIHRVDSKETPPTCADDVP